MDSALRRAWTEVVTPADYDQHMANIGQAQAAAELTRWFVESAAPPPGARVVIPGAGTGQMLDFLDPAVLRPYRLTFADLNPGFLETLRARLEARGLGAETLEDDIERTALASEPALLIATLLLEHIDWRGGVESFTGLRPRACGIVIQENPPGMTSAVTPGRVVPASIAKAMETAHATLVPRGELVAAMAARDYVVSAESAREVADGKRLTALLFTPRVA